MLYDTFFFLTHLSIVAIEIEDVLKRCDRVDLNDISIDSCKHVATVAKGTLRCGERRW